MVEKKLSKVEGHYAVFRRNHNDPDYIVEGSEMVIIATAFPEDKRHFYIKVDSSYIRKAKRNPRKDISSRIN